jgi:hypothetical protein
MVLLHNWYIYRTDRVSNTETDAEPYRYFLFHPNFGGRLTRKQHWFFDRPEPLLLLTKLIPYFTLHTTGLSLGRNVYVDQIDASFLTEIPVFPNVTDLEIHVSWDSSRPVDLCLIQRLLPALKRLAISDPGGYIGSFHALGGLEQLTLEQWSRCPEHGFIPYASTDTLKRLDLIDCFEAEIEKAEDEDEEQDETNGSRIRRFHDFENVVHLRIDPVHMGVETLLDNAKFCLETLQATVYLRNSNFDQVVFPRASLRNLRVLELTVLEWHGVGCAKTSSFLETMIIQLTRLSTLENILLQMPFLSTWPAHFKHLRKLTRLEWRVGYFWFDQDSGLDQWTMGLKEIHSAGVDMFYRAFSQVEFDTRPIIILKVDERYNAEGSRI